MTKHKSTADIRMTAMKRKARDEGHLLMSQPGYLKSRTKVTGGIPIASLMGDEEGMHDRPHSKEVA